MNIEFLPLLADGSKYPSPEFSMLPKSIGQSKRAMRPVLANAQISLSVTRARYALAIIAKAELAPGCKVLLPAYHCPALVEPFLWAGCRVDFYPLNSDLTPRLAILSKKLESADAMLFVPFFGFSYTATGLATLARQYNCIPIEDLAHAAHTKTLQGDYGVTSLEKFYPVSCGGELLVANSVSGTRIISWLKANQIHPKRWAIGELLGKVQRRLSGTRAVNPASGCNFRYFNPNHVNAPMMNKDIAQLACHDHGQIASVRRENYQLLDEYFSRSKIGQALSPGLGPDDVPYVYPFVLHKENYFDRIRNMAIPLYRWEEICPSGCEVSNHYRSHLIQVPCHQDLSKNDITRLIDKLVTIETKL